MEMKALDLVDSAEHSRPYNPNAWYDRCRGRRREQEKDRPEPLIFLHSWIGRAAIGQLEAQLRSIVDMSAEKPRWQKIIEHANSLADERGMTREEFYSMALVELIEKLENARISRELNEAYKAIDQEEDLAYLNELVSHYDPRLADQ